jgi:hypothetical protein
MKVIKEHHEEEEEERHLKSYILSHDVAMHSTVTEQNFMFNYHILDKCRFTDVTDIVPIPTNGSVIRFFLVKCFYVFLPFM